MPPNKAKRLISIPAIHAPWLHGSSAVLANPFPAQPCPFCRCCSGRSLAFLGREGKAGLQARRESAGHNRGGADRSEPDRGDLARLPPIRAIRAAGYPGAIGREDRLRGTLIPIQFDHFGYICCDPASPQPSGGIGIRPGLCWMQALRI